VDSVPDIFESYEHLAKAASWAPCPKTNGIRNEENALKVMQHIKDDIIRRTKEQSGAQAMQLFLGGDCSMAPAILCALHHNYPSSKIGIIYINGDCDLSLPADLHDAGRSGILDSMVLSHYTQRAGGLESIKSAFTKSDGGPLVDASNIVLFGQDPLQPSVEHWTYLCENQFKCFFRPTVAANPIAAARSALDYLSK
jgi:arginase